MTHLIPEQYSNKLLNSSCQLPIWLNIFTETTKHLAYEDL